MKFQRLIKKYFKISGASNTVDHPADYLLVSCDGLWWSDAATMNLILQHGFSS